MPELLEIRVKANTDPNGLGGAITAAWNEGREVVLVAIGPAPISQGYKAVCVANRYLAPKGVMLAILPCLETRQLFDEAQQRDIPWVVAVMRLKNLMERK